MPNNNPINEAPKSTNVDTLLTEAIYNGDTEEALRLIESGVDINEKDSHDVSPLFYAIVRENFDIALKLINDGAKIDEQYTEQKWTPLMYATFQGYGDIAYALLEKGARIDLKDIDDSTALNHAAFRDYHFGSSFFPHIKEYVRANHPSTFFSEKSPNRPSNNKKCALMCTLL